MSPSDSIAASASRAVVTPLKVIPHGFSSERAAAFRPLTISRSTRGSSLMTRMRLTGFANGILRPRSGARTLGPEWLKNQAAIIARMADAAAAEFLIEGITADGQPFRPSDWAERLCGVMAAFGGDQRMQYSPYVYPVTARGVRSVVVDLRLEEIEPMAYRFLVGFATDNGLRTRSGRVAGRTMVAQLQRSGDTE